MTVYHPMSTFERTRSLSDQTGWRVPSYNKPRSLVPFNPPSYAPQSPIKAVLDRQGSATCSTSYSVSNSPPQQVHASEPFLDGPPSPALSKRLLDQARLRKKAGRHVLSAKRVETAPSVIGGLVSGVLGAFNSTETNHTKVLLLAPPQQQTDEISVELVSSMLDHARLAKRKGLHQLSDDGRKLLLTGGGTSACSTSSGRTCYQSCTSSL